MITDMSLYSIFWPDQEKLAADGFGRALGVPFVFTNDMVCHRFASEFLIDRKHGFWHPRITKTGNIGGPITDKSVRSYADRVKYFLEWCHLAGKSPLTCNYVDDVYNGYQETLRGGRWAKHKKALNEHSCNDYVDTACDFLNWMAYKGYRDDFDVPTTTRVIPLEEDNFGRNTKSVTVYSREGVLQIPEKSLRLPTDEELTAWLDLVQLEFGESGRLMCETALHTAMRRAELVALRADSISDDPANWVIANPIDIAENQQVEITIRYGCKGPQFGWDHGDKIGPRRTILIPLHLVKRLHQYKLRVRPQEISKWVRAVRGVEHQEARRAKAVHLFRDIRDGDRIGYRRLYTVWCGVPMPFKGWSPHGGRHWWACATLWRRMKSLQIPLNQEAGPKQLYLIECAKDIIRLHIQPQLGHSSMETCMIYVRWLAKMLSSSLPEDYRVFLESQVA